MKYGSNEGVKRFSRLLQIVELYPDTMEFIANRLQEIPCWMFFDCLYQITAYLDKPIAYVKQFLSNFFVLISLLFLV